VAGTKATITSLSLVWALRQSSFLRLGRDPYRALAHLCYIRVMLRTIIVRRALSLALLFTTGCLLAASKDKEPAPRFNATTTTGEKFTHDSIKGKVVLLEFWTTWCGFCADEAAFVDKIGHELAGKGLILLAIDVGESKKTVKKYLEQHPRNCKLVMMEDTNLAAMYQANVYPIYVVIDREGFIVGTQRGAGGEEALRRLIARAGLESDSDADSDAN
jgi:thiol-disulfide isomerase/thioredoxin